MTAPWGQENAERLKRLYPTVFMYRGKPAGKLGGYPVEQDRDVRYDRTSVFTRLTALHGAPIVLTRANKTFQETHAFYADELAEADAGRKVPVAYPFPLGQAKTKFAYVQNVSIAADNASFIYIM